MPAEKLRGSAVAWGTILLFLAWGLFPLYWMALSSFKSEYEIYNFVRPLWVSTITLDHYRSLLSETQFIAWFRNSVTVGLTTAAFSVVAGCMAAYALSRLRLPGAYALGRLLLFVYLLPRTLLFIPMYQVMTELKLINSLWAIIFAYPTFILPFCTWMLIGYFKTVPRELEEAARVDGCSSWGVLFRIMMPLAAPAIAAVAIFGFTMTWNEYIYALSMLEQQDLYTVPIGIASLQKGDVFVWGRIAAAGTLTSFPLILLYAMINRYMIQGLTAGGVKG